MVRARIVAAFFGRSAVRGTRTRLIAYALVAALVAFLGIGASSAFAQEAPVVTVTGSSEVGVTSARLEGEVNPEGEAGSPSTFFHFEVSADNGAGEPDGNWIFVNGNPDGEISGPEAEEANPVAVEAIAEGLAPNTTYFIRLAADNAEFANHAETTAPFPSFTTDEATEPVLATTAIDGIGFSSATLHGTVDPEGGNVNPIGGPLGINWELQYREAGVFGPGEGWISAGGGEVSGTKAEESNPIAVEAELPPGSLGAATSYEVRLFAYYLGFSRSAESPEPFESFETEAATAPTVSVEDASSIGTTSAQFSGHVELANSDPAFNAQCSFEYVSEAKFTKAEWAEASSIACSPDPVEGAGSTEVSAEPTDLLPGTTYHLRLSASNQGGSDEAIAADTFTTEPAAPVLGHTFVSDVGQSAATLNAEVDPSGAPTTVHFEYLSKAAFEAGGFATATSTPESAPLGEDNTEHLAQARIEGLDPDTRYAYRAIATNSVESVPGEAKFFRTEATLLEAPDSCPNADRRSEQHSAFLPDCRAYEMVSPPEKNGGDAMPDSTRTRAAADGSAVSFPSLQGFGDVKGTGIATEYLSQRTPAAGGQGWSTHATTPPQDPLTFFGAFQQQDPIYEGDFSADLSSGVFRAWSPLTADPNVANVENLYVRHDLGESGQGTYELATPCPACTSPLVAAFNYRPALAGTSANLDQILFESPLNLTSDASGGAPKVYEWDNGTLRLASILPDGTPAPSAKAGRGALIVRYTPNTISADGSRATFVAPTSGGCSDQTHCPALYMRINGTTTVQLNASEKSPPADAPAPVTYWTASRDGSRVFFSSSEQLTDDPNTEYSGLQHLYMYDENAPAGERLTLIDEDHEPIDPPGELAAVLGASDDGRYVYFVADGQLVAGEPSLAGTDGGIYVWHDGVVKYVGEMANSGFDLPENEMGRVWNLDRPDARVTPDGRHFLFSSTTGKGLTGYDHGSCVDPSSGTALPCKEYYLYDADADRLVCVTCNPSGAAAKADAEINVRTTSTSASNPSTHISHALSDDGKYVFFDTAEALVPRDTNGKVDVYEYDATTRRAGLVSSGTDSADSYFMDAGADGSDVFFLTRQALVGWDTDVSYDLYDARVGGGLPEPPPRVAACAGEESCRGAGGGTPSDSQPGTAVLNGPGNAKPPSTHKRCRHGRMRKKVRGKTRCVKPRKRPRNRMASETRSVGRVR